jgi:hypothetical protein
MPFVDLDSQRPPFQLLQPLPPPVVEWLRQRKKQMRRMCAVVSTAAPLSVWMTSMTQKCLFLCQHAIEQLHNSPASIAQAVSRHRPWHGVVRKAAVTFPSPPSRLLSLGSKCKLLNSQVVYAAWGKGYGQDSSKAMSQVLTFTRLAALLQRCQLRPSLERQVGHFRKCFQPVQTQRTRT